MWARVLLFVLLPATFNIRCCLMKLSNVVATCGMKNPNLNKCMEDAANLLFPLMTDGVKELSMDPMDPLHIDDFGLEYGNKHIPTFSFKIHNSTHAGWRNARMLSVRAEPEKYFFNFTMFIPVYDVSGWYVVNGSILSIPLQGEGNARLISYNSTYVLTITGEPSMRRDEQYMDVKDITINTVFEDMTFDIDNVFNSTILTEVTNQLLNWNSKAIARLSTPAAEDLFKQKHLKILRKLFSTVPYRELFTDTAEI